MATAQTGTVGIMVHGSWFLCSSVHRRAPANGGGITTKQECECPPRPPSSYHCQVGVSFGLRHLLWDGGRLGLEKRSQRAIIMCVRVLLHTMVLCHGRTTTARDWLAAAPGGWSVSDDGRRRTRLDSADSATRNGAVTFHKRGNPVRRGKENAVSPSHRRRTYLHTCCAMWQDISGAP